MLKTIQYFSIFFNKTSTTKDGQHEDIRVVHAEPHKRYNKLFHLNDIGIVYLERDVDFTGNLEYVLFYLFRAHSLP